MNTKIQFFVIATTMSSPQIMEYIYKKTRNQTMWRQHDKAEKEG